MYKMFCKHDYEIINKTMLESAYEQTKEQSAVPSKDYEVSRSTRTSNVEAFFKKKLIILMKCPKCKKVKKIVETNP